MYNYNAKCIRVVDGDTIDAEIDLGFDIKVTKRIRLGGINAPESRTRNKVEKKLGLAAKERLKEMLEGAANCFELSFRAGTSPLKLLNGTSLPSMRAPLITYSVTAVSIAAIYMLLLVLLVIIQGL